MTHPLQTPDLTNVRVIADSINGKGDRLTSIIATFPRYILAELNTHRMFSRNSASSRAIPTSKMIKSIQDNPYMPQITEWMKEHSGMQGYSFFTPEEVIEKGFVEDWLFDRDYAIHQAKRRIKQGISKQIGNRHLESFMWHTAIVSSTEFENFFHLRVSPFAEPQFQKLSALMLLKINMSIPKLLAPNEWHIPFGDEIDESILDSTIKKLENAEPTESLREKYKVIIAVARCARVSYTVVETNFKDDYEADVNLYNRLTSSGHFSPFEHVARTMNDDEYFTNVRGKITDGKIEDDAFGWFGNFRGFVQDRKMRPQENHSDPRIIKHFPLQ